MGECLITRRGGEAHKLPVLDTSYPKDSNLTIIKGNSTSATFTVVIAEAGSPAEYTYKWYVNGSLVSGANLSSYTKTDLTDTGTYTVYCEVINKAGTVTSRIATLKVTQHYTPVLNSNYPANVTSVEQASFSATFNVAIATAGNPASYTYQWYWNGSAVSGATSSSYTRTGSLGVGSYTVYCKVTNAAGTVTSRTATLIVTSYKPTYTYSGNAQLIDDGNYNWRIKFLTSGVLNFTSLGNASSIDVFCVGGGGAGCNAGGGGGYTGTSRGVGVSAGTNYTIEIGAGGTIGSGYPYPETSSYSGNAGGNTSAFGLVVGGGQAAYQVYVRDENQSYTYGGNGGSGGGVHGNGDWTSGNGGSDGGAGGTGAKPHPRSFAGSGQGSTTREFGESWGSLYAGGGGGGNYYTGSERGFGGAGGGGNGYASDSKPGSAGTANTGGGGGGGWGQGHGYAGGSGIVVIRNKR